MVLVLLVAGSVSVTKDIMIVTDADPKINFSAYASYSWLGSAAIVNDPEGKWEPPQFDADAEIRFLIDRELRARGMTEASASPDIIVAYAAGIDMSSMDIKIYSESKLEALTNIPVGALTLVLIDARTSQAIWAGIATAEIQESPGQDAIKKRLDYAVTSMLRKLP